MTLARLFALTLALALVRLSASRSTIWETMVGITFKPQLEFAIGLRIRRQKQT